MQQTPPRRRYPSDHFLNRELSLLAFQRRVLAQAADNSVPTLERLRFLCIVSSNLDEFFEIRVAGLKEQVRAPMIGPGSDGRSATDVLRLVSEEAHDIVRSQYELMYESILPALERDGVRFLRRSLWNDPQAAWVKQHFLAEVMPILTPIGLDPSHPFPRVLNKSLNFAIELEGLDAFGRSSGTAIVQAPRALPRVIRLPRELAGCEYGYVFLSSVLHAHVGELFSGMSVKGCYQFRVTRNSDLFVDEEETKNLRTQLQGELPQRHFGDAVRLEVADNCPDAMSDFLLAQFGLSREDLYQVPGIVNLVRLMKVPDWVERPDLKYHPFAQGRPVALDKRADIFETLREGDVLLHHPYQTFTPVVDFLEQAVDDPGVVAIKMTVYRTGPESSVMSALLRGAQQGKEVTVVVELMARFDEEANLNWAGKLEEVGAHVVYGVVGYKTHAKMLMVVRREPSGLRRYVHLGTGNYHPRTARLYTDFGLLSANEQIGADVHEVFKQLTGLGRATNLKHLWQAPFTLHAQVLRGIRAETENARAGQKALVIGKMNSLLEPEVIEALYEASQAGVEVKLIIRGVCALRPGVPDLSENIQVSSIVGRFLEHSRVAYFFAGGEEHVYLSSADWMERNFFRRIELAFPILDPKLKRRVIREALQKSIGDNTQAWEMDADGHYTRKRPKRTTGRRSAQEDLLAELGADNMAPRRKLR